MKLSRFLEVVQNAYDLYGDVQIYTIEEDDTLNPPFLIYTEEKHIVII
jgi:hypothetical protein